MTVTMERERTSARLERGAPILEIDDLHVTYRARSRNVYALQGASLAVWRSEFVGLVGESGSGKSTVARAALGLLPARAQITGGRIKVEGRDVTSLGPLGWERLRGSPVAIVFQDPFSFLNPVMRVGRQIAEAIEKHDREAKVGARTDELLDLVRLPRSAAHAYPHELSGGMRQRVLLTIALACRPRLLIADEPTTALDVTTQAEIIQLLADIRARLDVGVLMISHNLAVVGGVCDCIYVMYGGRTIEQGATASVLGRPGHPYTFGLIQAAGVARDVRGRFATIDGDVADLAKVFVGCPFVDRCPARLLRCAGEMPPAFAVEGDERHAAACWLLEDAVRSSEEVRS
ncbi:MAG TPA: ABC transporter ATP-binding protein [Candidatus Limnocylindria bacterium]|nr:ABC transporter ATP-binding protein [Candidatus Limnocylindria bacterium]